MELIIAKCGNVKRLNPNFFADNAISIEIN